MAESAPRPAAVALQYNPEEDQAPRVVASGKGELARRIVEIAREHDIPFYRDPDLVEILLSLEVGWEVPEEMYKAVAEVLAFVYRMNRSPSITGSGRGG